MKLRIGDRVSFKSRAKHQWLSGTIVDKAGPSALVLGDDLKFRTIFLRNLVSAEVALTTTLVQPSTEHTDHEKLT